jgi:hypothetical protein
MTELLLTQKEADVLLAMEKTALGTSLIDLPDLGGTVDILLYAEKGREEFVLNYTRHSINLSKRNHHFRARKVIGLARLDLDGPPHRNPDGQEVGSRHLHLYREGFGLKWAFEIPDNSFSNLADSFVTLEEFLIFCNVTKLPNITRGLFA